MNHKKDTRLLISSNIMRLVMVAIDILLLLSIFICLRMLEYHNQLVTAVSVYGAGKFICWIFAAASLFCLTAQRIRRQKPSFHYVLILLSIPVFYFAANGRVPDRYEKLNIVNLVRQGEFQRLNEMMDYFDRKCTIYGGAAGSEDVFFIRDGYEKQMKHAYYSYGYLYSEDEQLDAFGFVHDEKHIQHLEGKWYKVDFFIYIY